MNIETWTRAAGFTALLALATAATGCRGGAGDGEDDGSGGGTSTGSGPSGSTLRCPTPGALPFQLESEGFVNPDAEATNASSPRIKDEATDLLGVPGGVMATTLFASTDPSAPGSALYTGRKARTQLANGLGAVGLAGENVSLWTYDGESSAWRPLGRTTTDAEGHYAVALDTWPTARHDQPVYAILEADGSCTEHYDALLPAGTKIILTDIDGTMTLSDEELFNEIADGSYVPRENPSASAMMQRWASKGYVIVYLTARPHLFRAETREWLASKSFPVGPVITANQLVFDDSARRYKRAWVQRITADFGWQVTAAYGNATSDIDAYEDAGIPKEVTFIIGPEAGSASTVAIEGGDFGTHIADFVDPAPDA